MSTASDYPPPFETTQKGILISWKTALLMSAFLVVGSGGSNVITNLMGIGGTKVSAEQFVKHEYEQSQVSKSMTERVTVCENAIGVMTETLNAMAVVQRMQVATEESRRLTSKIKNIDARELQFVRILGLNLSRMGGSPPKEPCYTLECIN